MRYSNRDRRPRTCSPSIVRRCCAPRCGARWLRGRNSFASRADRLFARQPVAAFRFADDGVALRPAVDGNALHAVHLDVVDAHDAGRQVVVGADDAFAHDVVEPLGRGVAQFEMQMGTQRRTAVARKSDCVALCDGPCAGAEPEIDAVRAAAEAFVAGRVFRCRRGTAAGGRIRPSCPLPSVRYIARP